MNKNGGLLEYHDEKATLKPIYYSIARTVHEIQGHQSYEHVSAPAIKISSQTLLKKAKEFCKANPSKFRLISVKAADINFNESRIHANSTESYINLSLHDELLNHYRTRKGVHIKKEITSLHGVIPSSEPVIKYIRQNLSHQLHGNSDAFTIELNDNDIRAIDKSISRQYKNVEKYIRGRFNKYKDTINNLRNSNAHYALMRDKLKQYLDGEYNTKGTIKLFQDKNAHDMLARKFKFMFDFL